MLLQREVTRARKGVRHVRLCLQKVERSFDFVDFVEFDFIAKVYARLTLSLVCTWHYNETINGFKTRCQTATPLPNCR